jgi:hypothetical protein
VSAPSQRAKIQPHMSATLHPLRVPPKPWHNVRLDYLTHLHVSNGFDNVLIVIDHQPRIDNFLPCIESVTIAKADALFSWSPSGMWTASSVG